MIPSNYFSVTCNVSPFIWALHIFNLHHQTKQPDRGDLPDVIYGTYISWLSWLCDLTPMGRCLPNLRGFRWRVSFCFCYCFCCYNLCLDTEQTSKCNTFLWHKIIFSVCIYVLKGNPRYLPAFGNTTWQTFEMCFQQDFVFYAFAFEQQRLVNVSSRFGYCSTPKGAWGNTRLVDGENVTFRMSTHSCYAITQPASNEGPNYCYHRCHECQ